MPTATKKLRVALFGAGHIAQKHAQALQALHQHTDCVGFIEQHEASRIAFQEKFSLTGYTQLSTLIAQQRPDMIAICTPTGYHAEHTIACADAGIHVICEKPMALTLADAKRMIAVCEQAGVNLFVVKQTRHNPGIVALHEAMLAGRFGKLTMISAAIFWTRPQSYFEASPWRGTLAMDGGALLNQASHTIDLLQWLAGPITQCHAYANTQLRQIETEDTLVANFTFANRALGSLALSILTYPSNFESSITLLGENATVKIGGKALSQIDQWFFSDKSESQNETEKKDINLAMQAQAQLGHQQFYEQVYMALHNGATTIVDGTEALKSMKILLALQESINTSTPIRLSADNEEDYVS